MTFEWALAKRYREGREEGREEGRIALIEEMLKTMSAEQLIAAGVTEAEIAKAKAER